MSQFKKKLTAFTAMLAFLSLSGAAAYAASTSDVINSTSNMNISASGTTLNVDNVSKTAGSVGQVDWSQFNVASGENVNFGFSGLSQTIINRVLGGTESQIYGSLTNSCISSSTCSSYAATSKVILINPAGILFGAGSTVDLNSFTASTFDFKGAKNLKDMTEAELAQYQSSVLNKLSPVADINGENRDYGDITFDSNYTEAFENAGLTITPGVYGINLNGTTMNVDKSLNIVSDNITYKDSLLRTGENYNYITSANGAQSFSNLRLVTADGVTFSYLANGYADDYEVAEDTKTDVVRTIDIDNAGLTSDEVAMKSGDIHIVNTSNASGSDIKIANSIIKGTKLVNKENGDIMIVGSHDVSIDNTRLQSINTTASLNGVEASTYSQNGGEIFISAGENANITDSLILSAGANNSDSSVNYNNAGSVRIYSYGGDVNVDGTTVISQNDAKIIATDEVTLNNSLVQAFNTVDTTDVNTIKISGAGGVSINNSIADSSGDINVLSAYSDGSLAGDIVISSDLDSNGNNQTLLVAQDNLSIQGSNTTIDNASLVYSDITFYNNLTTGTNNVTVANNSTFSPLTSTGSVSGDVTLETNGDFTLDNATMKRAAYTLSFDRNDDNSLADNGTVDGINYNVTLKTANVNNLTVTSTEGDVNVVNDSNITTGKTITLASETQNVNIADSSLTTGSSDITVTAAVDTAVSNSTLTSGNDINITAGNDASVSGSVLTAANDINVVAAGNLTVAANSSGTVDSELSAGNNANLTSKNGNIKISAKAKQGKDTVKAGKDVNIEATNGALYITDNAKVIADNDVNVTSYETITFGEKGADGINIDNSTNLTAGADMVIKSTNGDINAEKTTMPTLTYGDRLTFNAAGSNNFTSEDSLKSVNVDYIAGTSNNFTTKGDIQFVNSTLESPENNITTTEAGDVIMNNLTIKQATTNAKDTITTINAKGNVTTKDVTNSVADDLAATSHTFPQSVEYNNNGTTTGNQVLDINQTKLVINTKVDAATPTNDTNGSVILDLKNANNTDAGIEITAENTTWDGQVGAGEGPEVHLNAVDDELAISKIVTDKLFLNSEDNLYAADVQLTEDQLAGLPDGTPSKGYIEVRDYMGFNMDDDFTTDPTDFDYTGDYVKGTYSSDEGDIDVYEKHTINFDNTDEDFILVYQRPTGEEPNEECPDVPDTNQNDTGLDFDEPSVDSLINQVKIPREQVEISKTSKVSDNTVDQTSNIMSAAAKVDLGQDANETSDDVEDEK